MSALACWKRSPWVRPSLGATAWSFAPGHSGGPSISYPSTSTPYARPSPFHQARAVPGHTKKTIFDAWNGYHSVALKESDPPLSPHGGDTAIAQPPRATSPPGTLTRPDMMPSLPTWYPRPNALTMLCFGQTIHGGPSTKLPSGSISAR